MMKLLMLSLHFLILIGNSRQNESTGKHWALLVAGSRYIENYRHQADICHAYHVVRSHGIPPERIVVMMYDDIADNIANPYPGNIINEPNGPNLYPGVGKDYTGKEVTPEVFLKVLTGDSEGVKKLIGREGKVIASGPNDNIFVNYADHGAPGIVAFPTDEFLHADQLIGALESMYKNKQYKEMVIYMEACESGSMFNNLLRKDLNIFVTTAANSDESSYACYYDKVREVFLGDVYSVNWMQDSDVENLKTETLQEQFKLVKKETNTSHVMEYGDLSMGKMDVGDFQGNITTSNLIFKRSKKINPNVDAVRSEDVVLETLKRKKGPAAQEALKRLLEVRESTKRFFQEVVISVSNYGYWDLHKASINFSDFKCYKMSITQIRKDCPGMDMARNDYALRNLRVLANLCETGVNIEKLLMAISNISKITPLCVSK